MMKERFLTQYEIAKFIAHLVQEEKSQNTVEKYLRDVQSFSVFIGTGQVTKEAVIAYKRHLQSERYAVRSINSMLASVNSLFRFLGWSDYRVKTIKLQRQLCRPAEKELTKAEYTRLVNAAVDNGNQRLNLIIQTMCSTGIRISELQFITVEAISRGEATVSLKGKTRPVFIVRPLQRKLLRYADAQGITAGAVFLSRNGKPMNRTTVWREMKSLCKTACVDPKKVFPHNLRHLFARSFYNLDKDIAKLADILGHSSIDTTRIYTVAPSTEHQQQLERLRLIL